MIVADCFGREENFYRIRVTMFGYAARCWDVFTDIG
jgi:hypothetical protein